MRATTHAQGAAGAARSTTRRGASCTRPHAWPQQRERVDDFARRLVLRARADRRIARHAALRAAAPPACANCARRCRRAAARPPARRGGRALGPERVARAAQRVAALAQNLAHLNPQAVLERGYAIVAAADGTIVVDARQVAAGDVVALTFARGSADAKIEDVQP